MDTPRIFFHMRNSRINKDIMDQLPHFEFNGMMVTYRYLPEGVISLSDSLPVYSDFCEKYSLTEEMLRILATDSMRNFFEPSLYSLSEFARELTGGLPAPDYYTSSLPDGCDVFLCENQYKRYGAQYLMDDDLLQSLGKAFGESYFIVPSSIHELLLIPFSRSKSADYLRSTLISMNTGEMSTVNVLSDDVFFYDCSTGRLSVAC